MSIRDQILAEQSETLQERTPIASKLRGLATRLDEGIESGVERVQNVVDPGENRRSTNEDIEKLAEMLGKGVKTHIGTDIPVIYSPEKGGTKADLQRLRKKAKKGEEIVRLSPDLRARIVPAKVVEDMTDAQERDRKHRDSPTRGTVAKVKLPSTNDERERYAKAFRVKRGYGKGVGNKQKKLKDLTLKDSTEFADSVMKNIGNLREDSPPNRSTLKLQPIRRYTSKVDPDLRGKPQQHGGPGPESVTSTNDQKARMDRLRGTYPKPAGTTLKPKEEK